jgi:hypothetical protein
MIDAVLTPRTENANNMLSPRDGKAIKVSPMISKDFEKGGFLSKSLSPKGKGLKKKSPKTKGSPKKSPKGSPKQSPLGKITANERSPKGNATPTLDDPPKMTRAKGSSPRWSQEREKQ